MGELAQGDLDVAVLKWLAKQSNRNQLQGTYRRKLERVANEVHEDASETTFLASDHPALNRQLA